MKSFGLIRCSLVLVATCGAVVAIGQTLPATAPTAPMSAPAKVPPIQTVVAAAQARASERANVTFREGVLAVTAQNSSLNQILRDIARQTGMKISGGVTDERVYGTYGPSDTSTVLASLLNGTGSNMMLVLDDNRFPRELVLTPRNGGASPPNPNVSRESGEEDLPPQRQQRFQNPGTFGSLGADMNQQLPQQQPTPFAPNEGPQPISPPGGDTTTQQSPNGVSTPQDIYDKLMKMQQQQQKRPQ